jgi:hypothetical protein
MRRGKMHSRSKDWSYEDKEYCQKRHVDNKISASIHHIIGTFHSFKMNRAIEYESTNEFIFYSLLELDCLTERYYIQPVEVEIHSINENGVRKIWTHVPDVLVFRKGMPPTLYQIKDTKFEENDKFRFINRQCDMYTQKHGWEYKVIYPKMLPADLIQNMRFLVPFLKERTYYRKFIPQLMKLLEYSRHMRISSLVSGFDNKSDYMLALPAVYHLIAIGRISVNLSIKIDNNSEVYYTDGTAYQSYFENIDGEKDES